jgi:hypothetical protein
MQEPCKSSDRRHQDFAGCRCQAILLAGDPAATDPVCSLAPTRSRVDAILNHIHLTADIDNLAQSLTTCSSCQSPASSGNFFSKRLDRKSLRVRIQSRSQHYIAAESPESYKSIHWRVLQKCLIHRSCTAVGWGVSNHSRQNYRSAHYAWGIFFSLLMGELRQSNRWPRKLSSRITCCPRLGPFFRMSFPRLRYWQRKLGSSLRRSGMI